MTQYPQYPHNSNINSSVNANTEMDADADADMDMDMDMDDIIEDEQIMDDDAYEMKIVNNKTYIGFPLCGLLFGCHVSAQSFYKYNIDKVCTFLKEMSCSDSVSNMNYPEIMKLVQTRAVTAAGLEYTIHTVVIKTMWLRIVQRRWKKLMNERRRIMNGRISARNRKYNEMTGRHLPEYSVLPHIQGCLADIK